MLVRLKVGMIYIQLNFNVQCADIPLTASIQTFIPAILSFVEVLSVV